MVLLLILFPLMLFPTGIYAQNDKACSDTWRSERYACGEAYSKCYEQCGAAPGIAPESCYKACDNTSKTCEQKANANFEACKNASKKVTPSPEAKKAEMEPEPGKKITCDEVWKIAGSEDCERFVVSNYEGGVWCNLPDTRESLQPWIYGPAPTFTFTPGTCSVESADQPAEKPGEKSTPFNIFGFNPFETWRNIQGLLNIPEGLNSLVQTTEILSGPAEIKIQVPEPAISTDSEGKAWNFLPGYIPSKGENITVVKGQGQLKPSKSNQSVTVSNTSKNMPAFGTFVDSIFTGATSEMVTFRYTWGAESGAVVNVTPKTEIKFVKPAPGEAIKEAKRMIMLNKGEIEVKVKNTNPENKFEVQTEIVDLIVIGTHFWVSHDPDKKHTVVGVYEGKVEVKTKDGKTATVSPNGDPSTSSGLGKPGIVVVSQKLSIIKIFTALGIMTLVVSSIFWFIKRKTAKKKR